MFGRKGGEGIMDISGKACLDDYFFYCYRKIENRAKFKKKINYFNNFKICVRKRGFSFWNF